MKLSFGNITIDLNIFNLEKKRDQFVDVNLIQDEIYEIIDLGEEDIYCNLWSDQEFEIAYEISLSSNQTVHPQWQPPVEPLVRMDEPIHKPSIEEAPKLKLKILPEDRKSTRLNSSHSGESRMPSSA